MKRVLNLGKLSRIVEGDPNEVTNDEILVIRDNNNEDRISDIQVRLNGKLTSVLTEKFSFAVFPTPSDATVLINGSTTNPTVVDKNSKVTWSVAKTGYVTQSGTDVAENNIRKNIVLVAYP